MPRRSVALLIETSNSYARGVLEGISDYVRHHERWSIFLPEQERGGRPPKWLSRWKGDGIIARIETDEIASALKRISLPMVDVSAARFLPGLPWVETNDGAIARLGAQHLIERGFRNFAFCGDPGFNWSNWRKREFEEAVKAAGFHVSSLDSISRFDPRYSWNRERAGLAAWLQQLPRPIGILACYDIQAQKVLEVCRELSISVPEQIAVLGVDNDPVLCELADPPLSSIICNTRRTGFEAAALLDRMMSGEGVDEGYSMLIDPQGIRTRQSTDILAVDDTEVALALRFIRENAVMGIGVQDLLRHVPLSRRVLEHRFRKSIGRTPHEEINRIRLDRIRELLLETSLSQAEIAKRTGFVHDEYMSVFFRRHQGISPRKFRQLNQPQRASPR